MKKFYCLEITCFPERHRFIAIARISKTRIAHKCPANTYKSVSHQEIIRVWNEDKTLCLRIIDGIERGANSFDDFICYFEKEAAA